MRKQTLFLIMLVLVLPLLLAACGGDELDEDHAEDAIKALLRGDRDDAEQWVCEAEVSGLSDAMAETWEDAEIAVECDEANETMTCLITITDAAGTEPAITTFSYRFAIEDDKLCGGRLLTD